MRTFGQDQCRPSPKAQHLRIRQIITYMSSSGTQERFPSKLNCLRLRIMPKRQYPARLHHQVGTQGYVALSECYPPRRTMIQWRCILSYPTSLILVCIRVVLDVFHPRCAMALRKVIALLNSDSDGDDSSPFGQMEASIAAGWQAPNAAGASAFEVLYSRSVPGYIHLIE